MAIKIKNKPRTHELALGALGQFASRKPFIPALTHGVFRVRGKGSVLAASLLILSAILIIALSISAILVKEIKISSGSGKSNQAFQTANAGIEETMSDIMRKCLDPANCNDYTVSGMFGVSCNSDKLVEKDGYTVELFEAKTNGSLEKIDCDDADKSIYYISGLKSIGKDSASREQRAIGATVNDRHTKLLIHADGTDGDTDFSDSSSSAHNISPEENVEISTDVPPKFGDASAYFDGGVDGDMDYLEVADSDDWNFSDNDFIIQAWIKLNDTSPASEYVIASRGDTNTNDRQFRFYYKSDRKICFVYSTNGIVWNGGESCSTATVDNTYWHHVGVVRIGNVLKIFVDDDAANHGMNNSLNDGDSPLIVGAKVNTSKVINGFTGYIDEFRIWHGND